MPLSEPRRKALNGCVGELIYRLLTYYMLHQPVWKDGDLLTGTDFSGAWMAPQSRQTSAHTC